MSEERILMLALSGSIGLLTACVVWGVAMVLLCRNFDAVMNFLFNKK